MFYENNWKRKKIKIKLKIKMEGEEERRGEEFSTQQLSKTFPK
jgi:hypothetical protein